MSLDKAMKNLKYDTRLTEWNLRNNELSQDEYKKFLDQLPDVSSNVSLVSMSDLDDEVTPEEGH